MFGILSGMRSCRFSTMDDAVVMALAVALAVAVKRGVGLMARRVVMAVCDWVRVVGYGCGVSMYPQFFVEDLKTDQMLPRPYMRSFDGEPADQLLKQKWVLDLANRAEAFLLESIESRIMSDDSKEKN